ncbi:MAG: DUF1254 domain-containing protein, partial [Pseudolabrys sp.]
MKTVFAIPALAVTLMATGAAYSQSSPSKTLPVTADNFIRAETDLYFGRIVKNGGFGKFEHTREPAPLDKQTIIRLNRDTLYSSAVFDLDAGPVKVTLPNPAKRFMSMLVINEDHYIYEVDYGAGNYNFTKSEVGTRYVLLGLRTFADPANPQDLKEAHALQDAVTV